MYDKYKISIIIPCLNEARGIESLILKLPQFIDEIIVVDNNSTDNTQQIATSLGAKVVYEPNRGYGRAYKSGILTASGDIIVTMDGDMSYPTQEIENLLSHIVAGEADFVSGSRFPIRNRLAISRLNYIGNRFLTLMVNLLFFKNLKDSQSGMWAFKKNIYSGIMPASNGMAFSQEIKLNAILLNKKRFKEIPISYFARIGNTKLSWFKDGVLNLINLLLLRLKSL